MENRGVENPIQILDHREIITLLVISVGLEGIRSGRTPCLHHHGVMIRTIPQLGGRHDRETGAQGERDIVGEGGQSTIDTRRF